MKEINFIYWFSAMIGCSIGFGFNIILNYGTYIGTINIIYGSFFFIVAIALLINQINQIKFAKGEQDA